MAIASMFLKLEVWFFFLCNLQATRNFPLCWSFSLSLIVFQWQPCELETVFSLATKMVFAIDLQRLQLEQQNFACLHYSMSTSISLQTPMVDFENYGCQDGKCDFFTEMWILGVKKGTMAIASMFLKLEVWFFFLCNLQATRNFPLCWSFSLSLIVFQWQPCELETVFSLATKMVFAIDLQRLQLEQPNFACLLYSMNTSISHQTPMVDFGNYGCQAEKCIFFTEMWILGV